MAIEWISLSLGNYAKTAALPYSWLDYPVKVLQIVLPDFVGFYSGYLTRNSPAAIREPARWIWIVPAGVCLTAMVASIFTNLDSLFFSLFGVRGSDYRGEGVIGLVFPAVGFWLYSTGVRIGDKFTDPLVNVEGEYGSGEI